MGFLFILWCARLLYTVQVMSSVGLVPLQETSVQSYVLFALAECCAISHQPESSTLISFDNDNFPLSKHSLPYRQVITEDLFRWLRLHLSLPFLPVSQWGTETLK